ncbi:hypothetical protein Cal6303_0654 [Calothrix sp. PCC 6303]|nr:hypothetical protein Cal6303_0654 [Calothrix sp. PCC 6303]
MVRDVTSLIATFKYSHSVTHPTGKNMLESYNTNEPIRVKSEVQYSLDITFMSRLGQYNYKAIHNCNRGEVYGYQVRVRCNS